MAQNNDYKVVVICGEGDWKHYCYVRRNGEKIVFVANVYAGLCRDVSKIEARLRDTLRECGEVEAVEMLSSSMTVGARVTFTTARGASNLLEATELRVGELRPKRTCEDVLNAHLGECVNVKDGAEEADAVLRSFEAEQAQELEDRARRRDAGADDDGFITVTYKRKAVNEQPKLKAKKRTTHDDFYKFQQRDAKRQRLESLRAAVEKDKLRIAKVATARRAKFKPDT